jgi:hypothetical protein
MLTYLIYFYNEKYSRFQNLIYMVTTIRREEKSLNCKIKTSQVIRIIDFINAQNIIEMYYGGEKCEN